MNFDFGLMWGVIVPVVGGIVWAVRLEGRTNVHDALFADAKRRLEILEEQIENKINKEDCSKRKPQ